MVNLTITIPDDLKTKMDQFEEVNWSAVCRGAITKYIKGRENETPEVDVVYERIWFENHAGIWCLRPTFILTNNMDFEVVLDRMLFSLELGGVRSLRGDLQKKSLGSQAYLEKRVLRPKEKVGIQPYVDLRNDEVIELDSRVEQTVPAIVEANFYFQEFNRPLVFQGTQKIPIDEWKTFVQWVKEDIRVLKKLEENRKLRME